jgi:hypothetical protein
MLNPPRKSMNETTMNLIDIENLPKWPEKVAVELAAECSKIWERGLRGGRQRICRICNHPDRVALDTKLLMGAQPAAVIRDMQTGNYRAAQVRTHFSEHVLPLLVEATAVVGPEAFLAIPFPDDGGQSDQKRWFRMRYFSLSDLALKVCGKDGPNITAAIRATQPIASAGLR